MTHAELLLKLAPSFADIEFIGEGMTSRVYRARERTTGTLIALKVLSPHLATDPISLERFRREIRITRAIAHPQIIAIFDLVTSDEPYYLIMEFVDGVSLKDYLRLHAPVAVATVLDIMAQLFDVLARCHAGNVIHRDLKPQNIMMTAAGTIKVLDFGISRMTALTDLTQTGTSLGSPEYMAPELFAAAAYEPRSDLYAAGVIAFELLTGELPFQGDTLAALCHRHLTAPVPRLDELRRDCPAWLRQLIEQLLAKKPHLRYQSAQDVITDLRAQRVLSCAITVLPRRLCLACGEETPRAANVCIHCGESGAPTGRSGLYITCESPQNPENIKQFVADCFGREVRCSGRAGTNFLEGVDETYLETFKKAAQRYGLHLVGKRVQTRGWSRFVGNILIPLLTSIAILGAIYSIAAAVYADALWDQVLGLVQALALAMAILVGFDIHRKNIQRPLLRPEDTVGGTLAGLEWFDRLGPLLQVRRNEAMQQLVSQTLERFLLFDRHAGTSGTTAAKRLRELLAAILPVANQLSNLAPTQSGEQLAELMREHARRLRNNDDVVALEARMQAIFCAEDDYALLLNRFTEALALFNRLIGTAIVADLAIEQAQLEFFDGELSALGKEIEVWRRVRGELAGNRRTPP